jgi:hypothetical protein
VTDDELDRAATAAAGLVVARPCSPEQVSEGNGPCVEEDVMTHRWNGLGLTNDRWRASCACGWLSPAFRDDDDVTALMDEHLALANASLGALLPEQRTSQSAPVQVAGH